MEPNENARKTLKQRLSELKIAGLEDSSDSDGADAGAKEDAVALKDILAEEDSDEDEFPVPAKSPSPAKAQAVTSEKSSPEKEKAEETKSDLPQSDKEQKDGTLSSSQPLESPQKDAIPRPTSQSQIEVSPPKTPSHKEILDEILQESDDDDRNSPFLSPNKSLNRSKSPLGKNSSYKTPSNKRELIKLEKFPDESEKLDPLEIVNQYENSSRAEEKPETCVRPIEESMAKSTISISRMAYNQYKIIGTSLANTESERSWGRPSCICTTGNYFYIGTSLGVIRIFDMGQTEYRPIIVRDVQGQRLTSIDISKNGNYLIAGCMNGKILLWDLVRNELGRIIIGIHQHAVLAVKFLKGPKLWIMSSDVDGMLYLTEFSKSLVGLTSTSALLIKDRVVFSISPLYPSPLRTSPADELCLVGIGGVNAVIVIGLEPKARILWEFKRKENIKKGIPYIDWGRGALPGKTENGNVIMAIAWDKVVQLVEIQDARKGPQGYIFNGFYESEYEIQTLWWLAESVIVILTVTKELKLLYSGKFSPGRYKEKTQEEMLEATLMKKRGYGGDSPELEQPYKISEELYMQVYNIDGKGEAKNGTSQMKNSYHQSFIVKDHEIIGLTKTCVLNGRLLGWAYYMQCLKGKSPWLPMLRLALEVFLGTIKGFADISEYRSMREPAVRTFMKNYIKEGLLRHLEKDRSAGYPSENLTILQSTVEFCVSVSAYDFLFTELLTLFMEYGLEHPFLATLEPYILSNRLKSVFISRDIVYKQINYYVKQGRLDILERILLFLNLQGQDLEYLAGVCIENKMFSSLIYIKTLQGDHTQYIEPAKCMLEELKKRESDAKTINKSAMRSLVGKVAFNDSVEKSYNYLGYKLLWYIQICFKGEKFPQRTNRGDNRIPTDIWQKLVCTMLWWLLENEASSLQQLIKVDAKVVFQVLGLLFQNQELRTFITETEKYSGITECTPIHFTELLKRLAIVAQDMDSPKTHSQYHFNLFLAQVSAQPGTRMEAELCINTAKSLIGYKVEEGELDEFNECAHEKLIQEMLKNCVALDDTVLEELITEASKSPYTEVLIYLTETKKDYAKCFEIYLEHPKWEKATEVFAWLDHIRSVIKEEDYDMFPKLIYEHIEKMIPLDMEKSVAAVDTWFKQQHIDIIDKLRIKPKIQLEYLLTLLRNKEQIIEGLFKEESLEGKESEEKTMYRKLLELNINLLCEYKKDDVLFYVKKKYYPVETCLNICKKHKVNYAVAYLLKRTGYYSESLDTYILLLNETSEKLLDPAIRRDYLEINLTEYKRHFDYAVKVCMKHASLNGKTEEPGLWFLLLSHLHGVWTRLLQLKRDQQQGKKALEQIGASVGECIKRLLSALMGYVDMERMLEQIAEKYGELEVENFKEMFSAMIISYILQEKILDSAKQILGNQLTIGFGMLVKARHKAVSVSKAVCAKCKKRVNPMAGKDFFAFSCGHVFHGTCTKRLNECEMCLMTGRKILSLAKVARKANMKKDDSARESEDETEEEKNEQHQEKTMTRKEKLEKANEKKKEYYWKRMKIFEKTRVRSFPYAVEESRMLKGQII